MTAITRVGVERHGAVAVITLDDPDRYNALTAVAKDGLLAAAREVGADSAARAVVLTATGRSFCVGQDLAEHDEALEGAGDPFQTIDRHYNPLVMELVTMPKPVLAAVNGACAGAGLGLALACDLRMAADRATFATAFTSVGLSCDSGLSASLARAVGQARAAELLLLGERLSAAQAQAWGLVSTVVPTEELPVRAMELAERLAAGPTRAYAEVKQALWEAWALPLPRVLQMERQAQGRAGATGDHRRAVRAFLGKQRPSFLGR